MKELYRISSEKEPRAAWAAIDDVTRMIQIMDLTGEEVPWDGGPLEFQTSVGAFSKPAELIDLITPTLVDKATEKLKENIGYTQCFFMTKFMLRKQPYENAVWILKATPEELQEWATSLVHPGTVSG